MKGESWDPGSLVLGKACVFPHPPLRAPTREEDQTGSQAPDERGLGRYGVSSRWQPRTISGQDRQVQVSAATKAEWVWAASWGQLPPPWPTRYLLNSQDQPVQRMPLASCSSDERTEAVRVQTEAKRSRGSLGEEKAIPGK